MADINIGDRAAYTGSVNYGVSSAGERKAIRGQKLEESLTAPVAAPGAEQVQELSCFYNGALTSVDQIRHPFEFPDLDTMQCRPQKEAQGQVDQIKSHVQDEIGRLIQQDGTADDLDKRKGHVRMEYVEGDGYEATLAYDSKTGKPIHMESQVDGGRTWKYGYDRAHGSTPETYSRETISPVFTGKEGGEVDGSLSHHLKQTIYNNKDGTVSMREEEGMTRDEE
jgi:hypothetical protein